MQLTNELIKEVFDTHPNAEVVYFTSDGQGFFSPSAARNHAQSLKDVKVTAVQRSRFFADLETNSQAGAAVVEISASAKKILEDAEIDPATVPPGTDGKITKKEAEAAVKAKEEADAAAKEAEAAKADAGDASNDAGTNGSQE